MEDGNDKAVFTGDTLFIGGRLPEASQGPAIQTEDQTLIFLKDAEATQRLYASRGKALQVLSVLVIDHVDKLGQDPEIQQVTGETEPTSVMAKLREMKNNFK
ncbi:hydroxyacylglutathione hydrolase, variant 1 [Ilyonectria robusta]